jgi:putative ABC transport system permease protein
VRDTWIQSVVRDIRDAAAGFGRDKTVALVAIIALAVGIAANTAVFTVVNAIFLRNLPFDGSDRIVYLTSPSVYDPSDPDAGMSFLDFIDMRAQTRSFTGLAASQNIGVNLSDAVDRPERTAALRMTANGLSVLGQTPLLGRDFDANDENPGSPPVALLGYQLWTTRYGASPSVLGTTMKVDGLVTTIVGVTRQNVSLAGANQLWLPIRPEVASSNDDVLSLSTHRDRRGLSVFGRLVPGVSRQAANAEVQTIARRLEAQYPETNKNVTARVLTYNEASFNPRVRAMVVALQVAVLFVLLMACSNVANLLLARSIRRAPELSLRSALGASRRRLVQQLLVESMLLSIVGGLLGAGLAVGAVHAFVAAIPAGELPSTLRLTVDGSVLGFLTAVSLGTALLFGTLPALRASRPDIQSVLKAGSHTTAGQSRGGRLISASLVVSSVVLATVLLVGAGLMIRSLFYVDTLRLGIDPTRVATMRLILPDGRYARSADVISFHARLDESLQRVPGVVQAALVTTLPANGWMRNSTPTFPYEVEGHPPADPRELPKVSASAITPGYFRVMSAPLVSGREFRQEDDSASERVIIVNRSFASHAWPGQDPLGRRVRLATGSAESAWRSVVGVAPDILENDFGQGQGFIYVPYAQHMQRGTYMVARGVGAPASLIQPIGQAVHALDPDVPVYDARSMEEHIALRRFDLRLFSRIFLAFGVVALVLACTGLYAVVTDSVSQRSQEIGVRLAVGASPRDIVWLVFRSGMGQIVIGLVVGLALSLAVGRVLSSVLVGVPAGDGITLLTVSLLLALAGLVGCAVPARRALRVDPVSTLRAQ